jgi:hypothetical protein
LIRILVLALTTTADVGMLSSWVLSWALQETILLILLTTTDSTLGSHLHLVGLRMMRNALCWQFMQVAFCLWQGQLQDAAGW